MIDKRNQPYVDYLGKLEKEKFTGKVVLELNFFNGIIANMNREIKPLPGITERESLKLNHNPKTGRMKWKQREKMKCQKETRICH